MIWQGVQYAVGVAAFTSQNVTSLSSLIVPEHSKRNNNRQRLFYIHYYLLLLRPIPPLHKVRTFLSLLQVAQRDRHLKSIQGSSLSLLRALLSHMSEIISHSLL